MRLTDGSRSSLDDLLQCSRDAATRLEGALRRLRLLVDEWKPSPWQRIRPHASDDDDLLRHAAATLLTLRNDLRELERHLDEFRKTAPDARILDLRHRLETWRELLSCCRADETSAFLTLTDAHDWLRKGRIAAKRALVLGGPASAAAWQEYRVKAATLANEHAYEKTPEWRRVYETQLTLGKSLAPLVPFIEDRVRKCSNVLETTATNHEAMIHRAVAAARRETVCRLGEAIRAAELSHAELEGVDQRESRAFQALCAPGRVVSESLPSTLRVPPLLTLQDHDLAMIWAGAAGGTSYHEEQMRSARQAELAAIGVYRELYGAAEDLSIGQLRLDSDTRWTTADILAGDRWIDVKNARRSFSSRNGYSEHCVPRFKLDRRGQDVLISAFLSPYRPREFEVTAEPVVWLGETTRSEIAALEQAFGSPHLSVHFATGEMSLLPPWLFDYPSSFYRDRDAALARLRGPGYTFPLQNVHPSLALLTRGADDHLGSALSDFTSPTSSCDEEFLELARRLTSLQTVRRPVIFLHLLDRFCQSLLDDKTFPGEDLRWLLFPPIETPHTAVTNSRHPLVLCDPLGVVSELLTVLSKASETCRGRALDFCRFRLRGSGILQGLANTGRWRTFVAYCGGWGSLPDGRPVRCGQNPVFLGQDEPCGACDRLICHRCGYCGQDCPECGPRQRAWPAMESLPRAESASVI